MNEITPIVDSSLMFEVAYIYISVKNMFDFE